MNTDLMVSNDQVNKLDLRMDGLVDNGGAESMWPPVFCLVNVPALPDWLFIRVNLLMLDNQCKFKLDS